MTERTYIARILFPTMPPRRFSANSNGPASPNFPFKQASPSIGKLYRDIPIESDALFAKEDFAIPREHPYLRFCRTMHKRFPGMGKGASFTPEFKEAVVFLGWNLKPEEFSAAVKGTMVAVIAAGALLSVVLGLVLGGRDCFGIGR